MKQNRKLGILMLDTAFPRIVGDVGNPETFDFPVSYKVVEGASPGKIVREDAAPFLNAFVAAGKELVEEGASAISTSCGFLGLFQQELEKALPVPVVSSSLLQVSAINQSLAAGKRAGILTIAGSSITPGLLKATGVPPETPIGTTEGGREFTAAILENRDGLDVELARQDNVAAAKRLVAEHQNVGAIVLECTNMPPYANDIAVATGLPVYSIVTALADLWQRLEDQHPVGETAIRTI